MAETDCLEFRCPGEPGLEQRLRKAGYFEGATKWEFAENTGCAVSAKAMYENWIESTLHRVNILEPKFIHVGIGTVDEGLPTACDESFAAFSAVFGWRKP